jgi:hypothetical protein
MDKLQLTGQNLGRVFNFRSGVGLKSVLRKNKIKIRILSHGKTFKGESYVSGPVCAVNYPNVSSSVGQYLENKIVILSHGKIKTLLGQALASAKCAVNYLNVSFSVFPWTVFGK